MQNNKQTISKIKYRKGSDLLQQIYRISDYVLIIALTIFTYILIQTEITFAASLESQLDKVNSVANNKAKTIFLTMAFIVSSVIAVVKGNVKMIFVIVAILIVIAIAGEWIAGGMKIGLVK